MQQFYDRFNASGGIRYVLEDLEAFVNVFKISIQPLCIL